MVDALAPESARLAALSEEVSRGNAAAMDAFWAEVAQKGAPLIEPVQDDLTKALVTFVWRGGGETHSVAVISGLGFDPDRNRLTRLGETDLWYRSYRVWEDLRSQYWFAPNSLKEPYLSLAMDEKLQRLIAAARADPLNPRRLGEYSVLELPRAPRQPWIEKRPDVPQGKVATHTIRSDILGNERSVWVYTPPGYSAEGAPCALLLLFDGEEYTHVVPTPTILDNLLSEGKIPPMVAVLPSNVDQATRDKGLPCHAPHADFVVKELLPFVHQRYNVTRDPALTFIAGSSYGGLAAAYTAFCYPKVFGNVLSQSGGYSWKPEADEEQEWLAREFAVSRRKPIRFYMDVGLLETSTDLCPVSTLVSNRHMRDVLRAKGYPSHYVECSGGHDYAVWQGTLSDGLLTLLGMATLSPNAMLAGAGEHLA